jgi:hypothetical protein
MLLLPGFEASVFAGTERPVCHRLRVAEVSLSNRVSDGVKIAVEFAFSA